MSRAYSRKLQGRILTTSEKETLAQVLKRCFRKCVELGLTGKPRGPGGRVMAEPSPG